MSEETEKISFKKKRSLRQRKDDSDDDESNDNKEAEDKVAWNMLDEYRELQKLKKKTRGVNVADLMGKPVDKNETKPKEERKYGIVDAKSLTSELDLGHTFSAETNRRDEDTDMMKYIEEELAKKKGVDCNEEEVNQTVTSMDLVHDVFKILPEHLIKNSVKKNEEMLSNQMLNGIPEVELGIDERIRNIEATEEAKVRLVENRRQGQSNSATFVPINIAVNFVQHKRYNTEADDGPHIYNHDKNKRAKAAQQTNVVCVEEPVVVIGDQPQNSLRIISRNLNRTRFPGKDKATDDYMYERFKKQFKK